MNSTLQTTPDAASESGQKHQTVTAAQRAEIERLLRAGELPGTRIAKQVGCGRTTVYNLADQLGIKRDRRISDTEKAEIEQALQGRRFGSIKETAERLGRSREAVAAIAKKLGIRIIADPLTAEQTSLLDALLTRGGWTQAEISEAVGCPLTTVVSRSRKTGYAAVATPPTEAQRVKIAELLRAGELSDVQTAVAAETCPAQVRPIWRRLERKTARKETTKQRRCRKEDGAKRLGFRVFTDSAGNKLCVPTLNLWAIRDARAPQAVLRRAGLSRTVWSGWQRKYREGHAFFAYLYHEPADLRFVNRSTWPKLTRPERDNEIFVTEDMLAFRKASSVRETEAYIRQQQENGVLPDDFKPLPYTLLSRLRAHHPQETWIGPWLRGADATGDDAPAFIASAADIRHCRHAWDYAAILDDPSVNASFNAYRDGLELFPTKEFAKWVEWLYGGPSPEGFYAVPESVLELRERRTEAGIRRAAGVSKAFLHRCKKDPSKCQALNDAVAEASKGSLGKGPQNSKAWDALFGVRRNKQGLTKTERGMLRYAQKSTWSSALGDVMSEGAWRKIKETAARNGCNTQLLWLVEGELSANAGVVTLSRNQRAELVTVRCDADNPDRGDGDNPDARLFIPPGWMWKFRRVASSRAAREIATIRGKLPSIELFHAWLLDWTLPQDDYRSRRKYRKARNPAAEPAEQQPSVDENGAPTQAGPDAPPADRQTDPTGIPAADPQTAEAPAAAGDLKQDAGCNGTPVDNHQDGTAIDGQTPPNAKRKNLGGRPAKFPKLRRILSENPDATPLEIKRLYWKYNAISEAQARETGFAIPTVAQIVQARADLRRGK